MLRGGTIISTFCLSVLLLKVKIQKFQLFGTGLALIGILIVGASNVIFSDSSN
jgi:drug/metabolite transporter (DMT)-like permease